MISAYKYLFILCLGMKPRIKKTERQLTLTSPIKSNWENRCKQIILYKLKCMMLITIKKMPGSITD